jgi:uncharacterized protein (TIGR03083 family)
MADLDLPARLRSDVDRISSVLQRATLDELVPACPGWTVRQLVEHLGSVHRWATAIVQTGQPQPDEEQRGVADLPAWFVDGAQTLIETLATADAAAPCWSFTADKTVGFWQRRQPLETVVHRWDAERAFGEPQPIDPALAAVGVTEVVQLMVPRQVKLGRIPPLVAGLELRATDTSDAWALGESRVASVEAPAEVLLLALWHRVDPGDPRLKVEGDRETAEAILRLALAP